ncbi:FAD-binding oxidoreductase [Streptomyces sp. NPDC005708]|uniref:FAD-binding oxidoreductase n=1 Tax=unclassified Streptomyces TaxID=2593676 RepID=UPI0033FD0A55
MLALDYIVHLANVLKVPRPANDGPVDLPRRGMGKQGWNQMSGNVDKDASGMAGVRLRPEDVAVLRQGVTGPVLEPGAEGYEAECATYNLNCALRPAVVVGAANAEDVVAAVRFARRHGLPVAVKSAAHQMVSAAEGSLLITTQRMKDIAVDAEERTVRVGAGVRWSEVLPLTAEHGLAPVSGSAPEVGVVGYTLGGGQSPLLGRSHGYAADHVRWLDVVSADGELRRVTPQAEPDLYWALLGGKGNFGVVTAIEFEVFPVRRFYGGGVYFRGEDLERVLAAWRAWLPTVGEDMTSSVAIQRLPDVPALPDPLRGAFVVHLRIGYLGTAAEGEKLVAPLLAAAPTLLNLLGEKPYSAIGEIHLDPVDPMPYFDRCLCLTEFSEQTAQALVELTGAESGCEVTTVEIRALGGAFDREPRFPNSVPSKGLPYVLFGAAVGTPDHAGELRAGLARVIDGLAPWAAERNMVNFLSPDEARDTDEVRAVYGKERFDRLVAAKRRHDPDNVFRHNHNISTPE